jgi:hypothetical protein
MDTTAPDHLPQLRRHAHLHLDDAACLMAYVPVRPGNPGQTPRTPQATPGRN